MGRTGPDRGGGEAGVPHGGNGSHGGRGAEASRERARLRGGAGACGAMVARLTPDQKVAGSIPSGLSRPRGAAGDGTGLGAIAPWTPVSGVRGPSGADQAEA
eukprot:scaffold1001_cov334-Prasinococcus_capsulatus_cf.AAC.16